MAKDLPYFKFFCSEWNDGDITLEDYKTQGVFINVCSYYWSNECDVTIEKLNKRFKHNQEELTTLFHSELIKKDEAHIVITFLDEQQQERSETRKVRVKGGIASAEARRLKKLQQESNTSSTESQHVLNSSSTESQLLREEEIREEESADIPKFLEWFNKRRAQYLEIESNANLMTPHSRINLESLKKAYTNEDFEKAMVNICNDQWANESNQIIPCHFLRTDNFTKYLNKEQKPIITKRQKISRGWKLC